MILNNCTTCGRKPMLQLNGTISEHGNKSSYHYQCKCGKSVESMRAFDWTPEVAADMWNRANPVEDGFEFRRDYINYLAAELASYRLHVIVTDNGLTIKETRPSDAQTAKYHKQDLTEFYKKRLEPGVKV